jgi:hypothetical protein
MIIDFGKLNSTNSAEAAIHPREIFAALPHKKEGKFQYPRDVQSQVWDHWHKRKDESDLIIKMNTGSGKTVVGLLILKSCLNEKKGPAVYVAPDPYLVNQVLSEASDLGVEVTEDPACVRFTSGKAILVINIHKLVNGFSNFGVGDKGIKIRIGSLLIDDAHACLDHVEDQFFITTRRENGIYRELFSLFRDSLKSQCETKLIEIEEGDPSAYIQVPFWVWQSKLSEIARIFVKHREDQEIKFNWPLVKEHLRLCRCVVSSRAIEVSPHCIPIHVIPSIANAYRRIFTTATLVDDGVLATHFAVAPESLNKSILPDSAGDIGDRMILLPQVINPALTDENIKTLCCHAAQFMNVVVIVPSESRANFWKDCAVLTLKKENIHNGIERLKSQKVGLVVLVNRYDGIDLPKDACRLLVIDGLPDTRRLIDKVNQSILMESSKFNSQLIQRIEQGMGRGIRSSDDYCAVLLMGKVLVSHLYSDGGAEKFSPGTRAQLRLSENLSQQIQGKKLKEIWDVLKVFFDRNSEWVSVSKGAVAALKYDSNSSGSELSIAVRSSFDHIARQDYKLGVTELQRFINSVDDSALKGYLMQCLAEYINLYDESEAQKTLMSASSKNHRVLKPIDGISYHKLKSKDADQALKCAGALQEFTADPNKLLIRLNGLLEDLNFKPNTSNLFEESLKKIARLIGFGSQRPEAEFGKGPDLLWETGNLVYFVIECKNGATSEAINKHDCNQLNGSVVWFESKYDHTCKCIPILVHPFRKPEYSASLHADTRIIGVEELSSFKVAITDFVKSMCVSGNLNDLAKIREQLIYNNLRADDFIRKYTCSPM